MIPGEETRFLRRLPPFTGRGFTVILVSHSMDDVARLVGRIIVMNKGQIALTGTPEEVFAHADRLKEIGLDVPQITSLMMALKEKGMDVPTDIYTVDQAKAVLRKSWREEDMLRDITIGQYYPSDSPFIGWIPGQSWLLPFVYCHHILCSQLFRLSFYSGLYFSGDCLVQNTGKVYFQRSAAPAVYYSADIFINLLFTPEKQSCFHSGFRVTAEGLRQGLL